MPATQHERTWLASREDLYCIHRMCSLNLPVGEAGNRIHDNHLIALVRRTTMDSISDDAKVLSRLAALSSPVSDGARQHGTERHHLSLIHI